MCEIDHRISLNAHLKICEYDIHKKYEIFDYSLYMVCPPLVKIPLTRWIILLNIQHHRSTIFTAHQIDEKLRFWGLGFTKIRLQER